MNNHRPHFPVAILTHQGELIIAAAKNHSEIATRACNMKNNQNMNDNFLKSIPPTSRISHWKCKAIYRQGDDRVGQWSDVVSVPVAG